MENPKSEMSSSGSSESDSESTSSSESNSETISSNTNKTNEDAKQKKNKVDFNLRYDMSRPKLGRAVIFNNQKYDDRIPMLSNRDGSENDVKSMIALLKDFGFDINEKEDVYEDKTDVEAIMELEKIANEENLKEANCFFAVFLAHGDNGKLLMKKRELNIQGHILDFFRGNVCENLSGKPKIFLFQACRGKHVEESVLSAESLDTGDPFIGEPGRLKPPATLNPVLSEELEKQIVIPSGADFLLCYSSVEGYVSHRYKNAKKKGSYFIQTFADVLEQYKVALKSGEVEERDFLSLMTVVVEQVANISQAEKGKNSKTIRRRQIPSITSTLRKKIFFPNLKKPTVLQPEEDQNFSDCETGSKQAQTQKKSGICTEEIPNQDIQRPLKNSQQPPKEPKAGAILNSRFQSGIQQELSTTPDEILNAVGPKPLKKSELKELSESRVNRKVMKRLQANP